MIGMKEQIFSMVAAAGAKAGISPIERLTDPPSADPKYLMPEAHSVIALFMPLDGNIVRKYLAGQDQTSYTKHESEVNKQIYSLAEGVTRLLQSQGFRAIAVPTNQNYRYLAGNQRRKFNPAVLSKIMNWVASPSGGINRRLKKQFVEWFIDPQIRRQDWSLIPTFSHRYAAVAAGLGSIGWSGNLVTSDYGARVVLDSVITDAVLSPNPMLESSLCDNCRTCVAVCQSGYIHPRDSQQTTINGKTFIHNLHGHNARCSFVCGGLSGQSRYPEWATWSTGRVHLPDSDNEMKAFFESFITDNLWQGNMYSPFIKDIFLKGQGIPQNNSRATCHFCRLVCSNNRSERRENYRLIREAGERIGA
jgi:epoxyqueuosine reductase QueG